MFACARTGVGIVSTLARDVEADAAINPQPLQRMPLYRTVKSKEVAVIVDMHIQIAGSVNLRRLAPIERNGVIEVSAARRARAVEIIPTHQQRSGVWESP